MKKNKNKYLNFPVSFLKNPSLDVILELALQFCSYEMMVLNNGDKSYFDSLVQSIGFSVDKFELYNNDSKKLYEEYKKDVRCGVNLDAFINYLNKINENSVKDDLNLEFRAYCATKAIIGNKKYKKTNYRQILALMFGCTNYEDIKQEIRQEIKKYEDSRYMKRMLEKLQDNWHLSVYSRNSRGLYISYKLSPVDLIVAVKKDKYIYKNKQQIAEKKADKILDKLINDDDLVIDDDCVIGGDS